MKIIVSLREAVKTIVTAGYIMVAFMVLNCAKEKSEKEEKSDYKLSYDEIVLRELSEEKKYYNVFLDFKFGMSRNQVENKFDSLIYEGKVFQDSTMQISYLDTNITVQGYMYDFHSDSSVYKSIIHNDYFSDSLYIQTIVIYAGYNPSSYQELLKMYEEKYGDFKLQREDSYSLSNTIWVNGNREIIISELSGIGISIKYTDLKIRNSKKTGRDNKTEYDLNEKIEKSKVTESDI